MDPSQINEVMKPAASLLTEFNLQTPELADSTVFFLVQQWMSLDDDSQCPSELL